jgi:hypothetical protein
MWVGSKVYPLTHVTRVEAFEVVPRRGRIMATYARQAGACLALGVVGFVLAASVGSILPPAAITVYELVILSALIAVTVRLVRRLTRGALYVLSIATSGSSHAVVASRDRDRIHGLVNQVVAAIDEPNVSYAVHIDHVEFGGDAVSGSKIVDGVRGDNPPGGPDFPTEP